MTCLDCGKDSRGLRCRKCNGAFIALEAARAAQPDDALLLDLREREKLSHARIAARLGITASRVSQRLRDARRRQKVLADTGT